MKNMNGIVIGEDGFISTDEHASSHAGKVNYDNNTNIVKESTSFTPTHGKHD
ncbi:hypothetical protein Tco_0124757, partial [Tanacetum coccineum]